MIKWPFASFLLLTEQINSIFFWQKPAPLHAAAFKVFSELPDVNLSKQRGQGNARMAFSPR